MGPCPRRWRYDQADRDLLAELDAIVAAETAGKKKYLQRLLDPYLHPRGIKELAAPREIRLVYAMHRLFALGHAPEAAEARLRALQALRQEVVDGNDSPLRLNAARVLLQLMKLLVRSAGEPPDRRLALAHDLRETLVGHPRFIRRQLARHHLLEMPESWNQAAFDDHVYDANTKGRKTPTHLIMDAWIKGIRQLQVVYYDRIPTPAARELLAAGAIMAVDLRIGVEFTVVGSGQPAKLVWTPRGFASSEQFLDFLEQAPVREFFAPYAEAEAWKRRHVLARLRHFNDRQRPELNGQLRVDAPPLTEEDFLRSVGYGQPSLLHLAEFIHARYAECLGAAAPGPAPAAAAEGESAGTLPPSGEAEGGDAIPGQGAKLTPEAIFDRYFADAADPAALSAAADLPEVMRITPAELARRLHGLPSGCRLCLNLTGLSVADAVDVVCACGGLVTHLELFNLKDFKTGRIPDLSAINDFRQALNHGDVVRIKHMLKTILAGLKAMVPADAAEAGRLEARKQRFRQWLGDLPRLASLYGQSPLGVRIGSHSTGRYRRLHGMGFAVMDSLPRAAQRRILSGKDFFRELIPIEARLLRSVRYAPLRRDGSWPLRVAKRLGHPFGLGLEKRSAWLFEDIAARVAAPGRGNIATLGGYWDDPSHIGEPPGRGESRPSGRGLFNSRLKIAGKILIGFLAAFFTFLLTQPWWMLAYGGAAIWLGITAVRNVLQSVFGGGGWRRSELLRWKNFVSWQRVADSLLYTGLSVPLLELGVRYGLLERWLGLTAAEAPVRTYSIIAAVNGVYLAWHNVFRGLPKTAIYGNLFRAAVSIPLAIAASDGLMRGLVWAGTADAGLVVAHWAAIIAKLTSDGVAGLVEGYADRQRNIRLRLDDYRGKLRQLFTHYSRLETLFPEEDVLERLKSPKTFIKSMHKEDGALAQALIINALDLMYFRYCQPQAPRAWRLAAKRLTGEEREILLRSQAILRKEREIGQLFLDGLVGKNFQPGLSFYLGHGARYLKEIELEYGMVEAAGHR